MGSGPARLTTIDAARGLAILLVVYIHVSRGLERAGHDLSAAPFVYVDGIIGTFVIPLFLLLSGLFVSAGWDRSSPRRFMAAKVDAILYPYVLWSLMQGSIEVMMAGHTNRGATWADVLHLESPRGHFWFLYVLFIYFTCFALVRLLLPARKGALVLVGMALLGAAVAYELGGMQGRVASYSIYFAVGIAIGAFGRDVVQLCTRPGAIAASLVIVLAVLASRGILEDPHESPAWLLTIIFALAGSCLVVVLAHLLRGSRLLVHFGQYSMHIYLAHILAASGTRIVLDKVLGIDSLAIHLVVGMAAGMLLPLLAIELARRLGIPQDWLWRAPKRISLERAVSPR